MRRTLMILLFTGFAIIPSSCGFGSETKKVIKIAENLVDALTGFTETVRLIDKLVTAVTNDTRTRLTTKFEKGTLEEVTEDWEDNWDKINSKIEDLEDDYESISEDANKYFLKLRELETETTDETQRVIMKEKTDYKQREFNIAKDGANSQIIKLKTLSNKSGDFHNLLLQDVLLTQVNYRISELNQIQYLASDICAQLEGFSQTGMVIVR